MANTILSVCMILFLCLCLVSTAVPLSVRSPSLSQPENVGISAELLQQFNLMAQYAAAAYCPDNNNSTATPIICSTGNCPLVETAGAQSVDEFENDPRFDDTGFVAVDSVNKLVVLCFRGSVSDTNWRENWKIRRVHTNLCRKCHIHHGFWQSWMGIREPVRAKVIGSLEAHPDYRFVITGHSLGGALATLAAADFRNDGDDFAKRTELFTFGSPRVGNKHAVHFMSRQSSLSYRITSMDDPVPHLPTHLLGYYHTSPEYWINGNPSIWDFKILTGSYNRSGGQWTMFSLFHFGSHRHYFMPSISLCSTEEDKS